MSNNKLFEEPYYNYIRGRKISTEEENTINNLINYNSNGGPIFDFFDKPIFKTHEKIKWHKLNFEVVEKNKKQHYYKFEYDETLYPINGMSYIKLKKQLFIYFKRLLYLLNDHIEEDIIKYLADNFFNNISKCKYYKCLNWFIALFLFWFKSIRTPELYFNTINYKDFRKWTIKNRIKEEEQIKQIFIEFQNICNLTFKDYEDLKILLNFVVIQIAFQWGTL